jgi:endonuclease/exonuclease/phosphatase family metal-dependent hydrolase
MTPPRKLARISVMTFNIWGQGNDHWDARKIEAIHLLVNTSPDVLLLQEVSPMIIDSFENDRDLRNHYDHICDDTHPGWSSESNIYWRKDIFELRNHGVVDLQMKDKPHRGLFWAHLALRDNPAVVVCVATAHMPWAGTPAELETGVNQRIVATTLACQALEKEVLLKYQVGIFAGDFNDDYHPVRICEDFGWRDVFKSLDIAPAVTHPVRPSDRTEEERPSRTVDWIMTKLPSCRNISPEHSRLMQTSDPPASTGSSAGARKRKVDDDAASPREPVLGSRVIAAYVKTVRGRYPAPSDHMPVVAVIEIVHS